MELLIKQARIIDSEKDFIGDVYVKDGKVSEIGLNIDKNCNTIVGKGLVLMPAFVDTHTHFRDPGFTYKEDILTGSMAASKGGYTAVNLMPNTKPVCSSMEVVDYVLEKAEQIGLVDVHQTVSITRDFSGKDLSHLYAIKYPVSIITEDGNDVEDSRVMLDAMIKTKELGLKLMAHSEHKEIAKVDSRLSENMMCWRNIELAKFTGCALHLAHVSTKEAMEYVIDAKKQGMNITCEVMPHHIALTENDDYKVNPPLRQKEDVEFLINAIKEGWVDAIGTDHAPHSEEDKAKGAMGISGIETAFSVCYTKLVKEGHISLNRLSELMSEKPSELLGFNKGKIEKGFDGDLVLLDLNKKFKVSSMDFASKGKNTPFENMELYGEVVTTIKEGRVVYNGGNWIMNGGRAVVSNWWMSA